MADRKNRTAMVTGMENQRSKVVGGKRSLINRSFPQMVWKGHDEPKEQLTTNDGTIPEM